MRATVTFTGLDTWQMGRLLRAVERVGGVPEPDIKLSDTFDLWLTGNGENRIQVIKAIREITGLGLKEAKDMTEALPAAVARGLSADDAKRHRDTMITAGASVEVK